MGWNLKAQTFGVHCYDWPPLAIRREASFFSLGFNPSFAITLQDLSGLSQLLRALRSLSGFHHTGIIPGMAGLGGGASREESHHTQNQDP